MSSLALIRRIDQLPPDTKSDDPLDIVPARIVPNLDAPISLATNSKLWLFFIAYPAKGAEPPRMTLEFMKDGKPLRRAEAALPAPDADGNVRYIGNFPTSVFTPGTYDVKVGVTQAGATVERPREPHARSLMAVVDQRRATAGLLLSGRCRALALSQAADEAAGSTAGAETARPPSPPGSSS